MVHRLYLKINILENETWFLTKQSAKRANEYSRNGSGYKKRANCVWSCWIHSISSYTGWWGPLKRRGPRPMYYMLLLLKERAFHAILAAAEFFFNVVSFSLVTKSPFAQFNAWKQHHCLFNSSNSMVHSCILFVNSDTRVQSDCLFRHEMTVHLTKRNSICEENNLYNELFSGFYWF